ncbi:DUF1801 domain-containing protein [Gaiella sp.]|uniref:DUF1801 domain-containing protein n=1 Tax=Gaiella sp. TaxID=2663207 RepID=UPI0032677FE7
MAQSKAATVTQYLSDLPPERASIVSSVRDLVNQHLPTGFDETMRWGMISWEIPLERYPNTYNGQPLNVVSLAAQRQYTSLYLMCVYIDPEGERRVRDAYANAGVRLDFGKSCLRFKSLDRFLPEAVIPILERSSVEALIGSYEAARGM